MASRQRKMTALLLLQLFSGCETKVDTKVQSSAVASEELDGTIAPQTFRRDFTKDAVIENRWVKVKIDKDTFTEPYSLTIEQLSGASLNSNDEIISPEMRFEFRSVLRPDALAEPTKEIHFTILSFQAVPEATWPSVRVNVTPSNNTLQELSTSEAVMSLWPDGRLAATFDVQSTSLVIQMRQLQDDTERRLPPVTGLVAKPDVRSIQLNWNAVVGAEGYRVHRRTRPGVTRDDPFVEVEVEDPALIQSELDPKQTYYFLVEAYANGKDSSFSSEVAQRPIGTSPETPEQLAGLAFHQRVQLQWSASAGAEAYTVYVGLNENFDIADSQTVSIPTQSAELVVEGLDNDTNYYFRVAANNAFGESDPSDSVEVIPGSTNPTVVLATQSSTPTNLDLIPFTVVFSEPVSGFAAEAVQLTGATITDFVAVDSQNFAFNLRPVADGVISVAIPEGAGQDQDLNPNRVSTTVVLLSDRSRPKATLATQVLQPTNGPFQVSISWDEPIIDQSFTLDDVTVTNGTASNFQVITPGRAYAATFTPQADGDVVIAISQDGTRDLANNGNEAVSFVVKADLSNPTVVSVTAKTANGAYKAGDKLELLVNFSEPVIVTGTPRLALAVKDIPPAAIYESGSGSTSLTFSYVAQTGDSSGDLDYASINALILNGGKISDAPGNDAVLSLPTPGAPGSLSSNASLVIDTKDPTITKLKDQVKGLAFRVNLEASDSLSGIASYSWISSSPNVSIVAPTDEDPIVSANADGSYIVSVTVKDRAGNSATDSFQLTWLSTAPIAELSGAPNGVNSATTISVAVAGTNVVKYRFKVGSSSTTACSLDVGYSTLRAANLALTSNIAAMPDGDIRLCVVGQNSAGIEQPLNAASVATWRKDTTKPTVVNATAITVDGAYRAGSSIDIELRFSEQVFVTGTPELQLETGSVDRKASFIGGSALDRLRFRYTIQAGDTSADLDYKATNSLNLNGGTIKDEAGNAATLTLRTPGTSGSIAANSQIVVDTTPPTIAALADAVKGSSFTVTPSASDSGSGINSFAWSASPSGITFSTQSQKDTNISASADGNYTITLTVVDDAGNSADASFVLTWEATAAIASLSGAPSGTNKLTILDVTVGGERVVEYRHKVGPAQSTNCSVGSGYGSPTLVTQKIQNSLASFEDGDLRLCVLAINQAGVEQPLGSATIANWKKDTIGPQVLGVSSSLADGAYGDGQLIPVSITFNEPVFVQGTPRLQLALIGQSANANYSSGSGTSTLIFNYTVAAGHNTNDLNYSTVNALSLNGGTLRDGLGTNANLALPSLNSPNSLAGAKAIMVDTLAPAITTLPDLVVSATFFLDATVAETGSGIQSYAWTAPSPNVSFGSPTSEDTMISASVDGTYEITLTVRDVVGNEASASFSLNWLSTAPTASISGAPSGTNPATSLLVDVSGNNVTTYRYKVGLIATTNCSLGNGYSSDKPVATRIADTLGVDGDYRLCVIGKNQAGVEQGLTSASTASWRKDTTAPSVIGVTAITADGSFKAGAKIDLRLQLSEPAIVVGQPILTLETGATDRNATFKSATGNIIDFEYTVQQGDRSPDLDYISTSAFSLGTGGSIKDAALNDAVLTLPAPGGAGSLGANSQIVIDTGSPSIDSLANLIKGQAFTVTAVSTDAEGSPLTYSWSASSTNVAFSNSAIANPEVMVAQDGVYNLTVTATDLAGNSNSESFQLTWEATPATAEISGAPTGVNKLTTLSIQVAGDRVTDYQYKVGLAGSTSCSVASGYSSARPIATKITDDLSSGQDGDYKVCVLGLNQAGIVQSIANATSATWTKDTRAPAVVSVSGAPLIGAYKVGSEVIIEVTFDETVMVTGTPKLQLETGSTDRQAAFDSGSPGTVLRFKYIVQSGDTSSDLNYVATNSLTLSGGTIQDAATNGANRTLPGLANAKSLAGTSAIVIDTTNPTIANIADQIKGTAFTLAADVTDAGSGIAALQWSASSPNVQFGSPTMSTTVIEASSDGTYTITLTATDLAGNTADQQFQLLWEATPAVAVLSDAPTRFSTATTINVGVSGARVTKYRHKLGQANNTDCESATGYSAETAVATNITGSIGADADYVLCVVGINQAGIAQSFATASMATWTKDTTPPAVLSVTSTTANGAYNEGSIINLVVNFSETVAVTGSPTLTLAAGPTARTAQYVTGDPGTGVKFRYTVQANDSTADLDYASTGSLSFAGGTIKDAAGNGANLLLPALGSAASLAGGANIKIDTQKPTISALPNLIKGAPFQVSPTVTDDLSGIATIAWSSSSLTNEVQFSDSTIANPTIQATANGIYTILLAATDQAGNIQESSFTLTWDSTVPTATISGEPTGTNNTTVLDVAVGGAGVTSYSYKLDSSCTDPLGYSTAQPVAEKIDDDISGKSDGNVTLCVVGINQAGLSQDFLNATTVSWVKDTTGPSITRVTSPLANGSYTIGTVVPIVVEFNEAVLLVGGPPTLRLETGAVDADATFDSLSNGTLLNFNYTVAAGHASADLNYLSTTALLANGATFTDAVGNPANITLPALPGPDSLAGGKAIIIDTTAPASPATLTGTAGFQRVTLDWTQVPSTTYLLIRKESAAVDFTPVAGQVYAVGTISTGQQIIFVGTGTTFLDSPLTNGTTYNYALFAFDEARNYSTGTTSIATPVNTAPNLDDIEDQNVSINMPITEINAGDGGDDSDADGQALTYSCSVTVQTAGDDTPQPCSSLGASLTFQQATGILNWTPSAAGEFLFSIMATDGELEDRKDFTITVTAVQPTITAVIPTKIIGADPDEIIIQGSNFVGTGASIGVTLNGNDCNVTEVNIAGGTIKCQPQIFTFTSETPALTNVVVRVINSDTGSSSRDDLLQVENPPLAIDSMAADVDPAISLGQNAIPLIETPGVVKLNISGQGFFGINAVSVAELACGNIVTTADGTGLTCDLSNQAAARAGHITMARADSRAASKVQGATIGCPENYVWIDLNESVFINQGFCVAKYEMKNRVNVAVSMRDQLPWVGKVRGEHGASADSAWKACRDLGDDYDMVSNRHWQAIAREIASQAANWSSGVVGEGEINRGNSEDDILLHASLDTDPCFGTTAAQPSGECLQARLSRVHHLKTFGMRIWDFSGNAAEWVVEDVEAYDSYDGAAAIDATSHSLPSDLQTTLGPGATFANLTNDGGLGFAQFTDTVVSRGQLLRGGHHSSDDQAGIFATRGIPTEATPLPEDILDKSGFRCVYIPGQRARVVQVANKTIHEHQEDSVGIIVQNMPFLASDPGKAYATTPGNPTEKDSVSNQANPTLTVLPKAGFVGEINFRMDMRYDTFGNGAKPLLRQIESQTFTYNVIPRFYAFVTETKVAGDFNDGDAVCASEATSAISVLDDVGAPTLGFTWRALLGVGSTEPEVHLAVVDGAIFLADAARTPIAKNIVDLLAPPKANVAIHLTQAGASILGLTNDNERRVWTGIDTSGNRSDNCSDWTVGSGQPSQTGLVGGGSGVEWLSAGSNTCQTPARLYCIGFKE